VSDDVSKYIFKQLDGESGTYKYFKVLLAKAQNIFTLSPLNYSLEVCTMSSLPLKDGGW
jgi:hypothetical protein